MKASPHDFAVAHVAYLRALAAKHSFKGKLGNYCFMVSEYKLIIWKAILSDFEL
jgi:hypothetical protein